MMTDGNKKLYMVVDIEKNKKNPNYAWVSFVGLDNGLFFKRWKDLSRYEQIKCGAVGTIDMDDIFHSVQNHFDIKQPYSVAKVLSVDQAVFNGRNAYKYHVGLSTGDFDKCLTISDSPVAICGNDLLLRYDAYKMNLTMIGNCWDLWHHHNMRKYGLCPSYGGSVLYRYWNDAFKKGYKNYKGEKIIPAVVQHGYGDDEKMFRIFTSEVECDHWRDIQINVEGMYQPKPRPSDIILLKKTDDKDKFVLAENLTVSAELRNMQNKFGLRQHQAAMMESYQKCFGERE